MRGLLRILVIISLFLSLSACWSNSAPTASLPMDTPVSALTIAEQVSYITPQEELSSSSSNLIKSLIKYAAPTSGDYITDKADYYVYEESMQSLQTVNMILCSIKQTRYYEMVNQGDYAALINYNLCEKDRSQSSDQSSGKEVKYTRWIVNSSRESEDDSQIVKAWIENIPDDDASDDNPTANVVEIRALMTITAEADETNPFGLFEMNMVGYTESGKEAFQATLKAEAENENETRIQMWVANPLMDSQFSQTVNAVLDNNADSGRAYAASTYSGYQWSSKVSYDESFYHAKNSYNGETETKCLDRKDYVSSVYKYNLYESAGSRVEQNSGFSILYGTNTYGYADYYGVWLPEDEVALASGLSITHENENYTTLVGGGSLVKRTRIDGSLSEIKNELFNFWDDDSGYYYKVKWNGSNFVATAYEVCSSNCYFESITETVLSFDVDDWIYLWKDGYGYVQLVVPDSGLSNNTDIVSYQEEKILPDDLSDSLTLYCYYDCPKANLTASDFNDEDPFYNEGSYSDTPYVYTFDPVTYSLKYAGKNVSIDTGAAVSESSYYHWGLSSGDLLSSEISEYWDLWDVTVSYIWETGPNSWNKHSGLVDDNGDAVLFDEPITCNYEDDEHGTYVLEYGGDGELWGIPFELDEDSSSDFEHWTSLFVIPDGTALDCDGTTYYTKAMAVEEFMQTASSSQCSHLDFPSDLSEPKDLYTDPGLGATPEVEEPTYIGGKAMSE